MRVLLAIEAFKSSEWAVRAITNQMKPDDAEVSILHVIPRYASPETVSRAREFAAKVEAQLKRSGFKAAAAIAEGDPRSIVVDHASRWKADLIVVGSDGRPGFARFLTRSAAADIARRSPCSVQVVRTPVAQSRILLVTNDSRDGSEDSQGALQQLIAQKIPQGTEVRVLQLIEALPLLADGHVWRSGEELANARQEQYRKAESFLQHAAQALRSAGFQASTAIGQRISASTVTDTAKQWHAGLIMMGSSNPTEDDLRFARVSAEIAGQETWSVQIARTVPIPSPRQEEVLV
jgi:nucleotide-binding universal stress UspA family protein